MLGQAREPFEIVCQFDEATEDPKVVGMRAAEVTNASPGGDGKTWSVPIGPPFLSFTQDDMRQSQFVAEAGTLMMNWLAIDRRNVIRALLGVAYVEGIKEWATNDFARKVVVIKQWMAWTDSPTSSKELAKVLEPMIVNLGVHLQLQDDRGAYALIPALELFSSLAVLSPMGSGLVDGLKRAQTAGLSPKQ